jgi:hypothetical protein
MALRFDTVDHFSGQLSYVGMEDTIGGYGNSCGTLAVSSAIGGDMVKGRNA